ncbi:uncharacterized protein Eint_050070 [Encephalitozoon intestinalis ATCC 50506]|uniref:Uncharacterized protein n=1 Tax=Encephalitozoon intestinalis (strain ATCC 50506) TaxID=876142 RepID=E0S728_ENCIT|nr:uncharacterized protein Eint_050070 [Encephalitozoon intestinalis ATCC 50506]ADM11456.1 hypothetical protein Eint_050070 [Encephalitozoon intestinalis ATCC 50506]UTX45165.1 hypothetical protein GPK93_05g07090 [Encephalitozoon intestinalis]
MKQTSIYKPSCVFLFNSGMNVGLRSLYFIFISMAFMLMKCRCIHHSHSYGHSMHNRRWHHRDLRGWRHPVVERNAYAYRRRTPAYNGREMITLEELRKPNVPIIVPYEVTPKQVLTLLRH